MLGNQGPDPLFFLTAHPTMHSLAKLGSRMHREHTTELVEALSQSLTVLDDGERAVGLAYAQGFLGHFSLDSHAHPLVYCREYAICDAGIEGLTRDDGTEVHAAIETEIDEMVLSAKRGQTVREYPAVDNTLEASPEVLATIQKMYAYLALYVFGQQIPAGMFATAVECYRIFLSATHSPLGIKRMLGSRVEQAFRPHSLYGAMSHRARIVEDSWFANSSHETWENPFTGDKSNDSFWDVYQKAIEAAGNAIELFDSTGFGRQEARAITRDVNFSGAPTVATLTIEG